MKHGIKVIDADGHVLDNTPKAIRWEEWLEEPYRSRAPVPITFPSAGADYFLEGRLWPTPALKGFSAAKDNRHTHESREGMWVPQKRIQDMDAEGIDVAVLFGGLINTLSVWVQDQGMAAALCKAFNNWMASYCKPYPQRLKTVVAAPLKDTSAAVREIDRAVGELGSVGVLVPPNAGGKTLDHPDLIPSYKEMARLGVPACIHTTSGVYRIGYSGAEQFDNKFYANLIGHPYGGMTSMASFICGGVLDQVPDLRVAFLEAGAGWIPYWIARMDDRYETWGYRVEAKAKPSEYLLGGQCFFSCDADEALLPAVVDYLGEDHVMYASDYWHFDAEYFGSVDAFWKHPGLKESAKRKLLGENAIRFFKLKV